MERFLSGEACFADRGRASRERAERLFDVERVNCDMMKALGLVSLSERHDGEDAVRNA
jgi:hypothetical protein